MTISPRVRSWARNLILLGVSTGVSIVALEYAVRIFLPVYDPSGNLVFTRNAEGYVLGPAGVVRRHWTRTGDFDVEVRFSPFGLRDAKSLTDAKPSDLFVIGDSFTFGWGVEESERYSNVLEKLVGQPVYNVSAPNDLAGYLALRHYVEGRGIEVGRLVVGVCMENDLKDYETNRPMYEENINVGLVRVKSYLERRSALYTALATVLHSTPALQRVAYATGLLDRASETVNANRFDEPMIQSSVRMLERVTAGTDAHILIIPSRGLWIGDNRTTEGRVHERFVQLLRSDGLDVIDPRHALEEGGDALQYHFKENPHWNAKGHDLVAHVIAATLERTGGESVEDR